ncbi:hypothetical protein GGR56DRAFT_152712 [Xylariaceae sp. FL0804]|nr:hypothetical protein GGR56DRAFT_152712 [Xylariaceae sp. FL0804]
MVFYRKVVIGGAYGVTLLGVYWGTTLLKEFSTIQDVVSRTAFTFPLPKDDPLWSSEQHQRYFGESYWRARGNTHVPYSFHCKLHLPLYRVKQEWRETEDALARGVYRAVWKSLIPEKNGGMAGYQEPPFVSPENPDTRHFCELPASLTGGHPLEESLETVENKGNEIMLRKQIWRKEAKSGIGASQELWVVEATMDRTRGIAEVGIRACMGDDGWTSMQYQRSIRFTLYNAGLSLLTQEES